MGLHSTPLQGECACHAVLTDGLGTFMYVVIHHMWLLRWGVVGSRAGQGVKVSKKGMVALRMRLPGWGAEGGV